jgi:hypothetical protein
MVDMKLRMWRERAMVRMDCCDESLACLRDMPGIRKVLRLWFILLRVTIDERAKKNLVKRKKMPGLFKDLVSST